MQEMNDVISAQVAAILGASRHRKSDDLPLSPSIQLIQEFGFVMIPATHKIFH